MENLQVIGEQNEVKVIEILEHKYTSGKFFIAL